MLKLKKSTLTLKCIFPFSRIRSDPKIPDGVTERCHTGKLPENVPNRCRNVSRGTGVLFSCKNDRNQLSDRVVIGEFDENFPKSDRQGVVLGVPDPPKIGFEKKDPGFSVSRFLSDDPQILSRFHQRRKKLGPKMSTGGESTLSPPVTGEWKYAL